MGFHKSFCVAAKQRNKPPASFQPQMAANLWFNSWESSACLPLTLCQRQSPAKAACLRQVIQNSPSTCFETGLLMVLNWRRKNQHILLQLLSTGNQQSRIQMKKDYIIDSPDQAAHIMSGDGREVTGSLGFFGFLVTAHELSHKRSIEQCVDKNHTSLPAW